MFDKFRNLIKKIWQRDYDYIFDAISWRLPDWLFYYNHSFLLRSDDPRLPKRQYTTYFKKFITGEDCDLLEENGYPRELVLYRLSAGDRGIMMGKDNEIASITWAAAGKRFLKLAGATLDPGPDGVIFYGAHTEEYARLKGLFSTALADLYDKYVAEGRFRIYSNIDVMNANSLSIHKRIGFNIIGETRYVILFGVGICHFKSWPFPTKRVHLFIKRPPGKLKWV
jgi:hypothetical protein